VGSAHCLDGGDDAILRLEGWIERQIGAARNGRRQTQDVGNQLKPRDQVIDDRVERAVEMGAQPLRCRALGRREPAWRDSGRETARARRWWRISRIGRAASLREAGLTIDAAAGWHSGSRGRDGELDAIGDDEMIDYVKSRK
jgi:hypothetical protein